MNLFEINDYRKYIEFRVKSLPNRGRGEYQKIAQYLNIQGSVLSQIMGGLRELGSENALKMARYFNLMPLEEDYFIQLAMLEKASHYEFKKYIKDKLEKIRLESQNIKNRIQSHHTLSQEDQSQFYSSWMYSAIRLLCGIGNGLSFEHLQTKFQIPSEQLQKMISFLLEAGLLTQDGQFLKMGLQTTYVGKDSPHLPRHQMNWRIRATDHCMKASPRDFLFTAPMTCSEKDFEIIKKILTQSVQDITKIVNDSVSEKLFYFGIDLFSVMDS